MMSDNMANREINRRIAHDVFGLKVHVGRPNYAGNIEDAWLVVEAMKYRNKNLQLVCYAYDRTYASFGEMDEASEANGPLATPEAICRAALKVVTTA